MHHFVSLLTLFVIQVVAKNSDPIQFPLAGLSIPQHYVHKILRRVESYNIVEWLRIGPAANDDIRPSAPRNPTVTPESEQLLTMEPFERAMAQHFVESIVPLAMEYIAPPFSKYYKPMDNVAEPIARALWNLTGGYEMVFMNSFVIAQMAIARTDQLLTIWPSRAGGKDPKLQRALGSSNWESILTRVRQPRALDNPPTTEQAAAIVAERRLVADTRRFALAKLTALPQILFDERMELARGYEARADYDQKELAWPVWLHEQHIKLHEQRIVHYTRELDRMHSGGMIAVEAATVSASKLLRRLARKFNATQEPPFHWKGNGTFEGHMP